MNKIHKLYLFEGLNTYEITSLALDEKERLTREGRTVKMFTEGSIHPADMASHAYLSFEEYKEFLNDVLLLWNYNKCCTKEELMERILKQTHFEEDHAIIAYRQIQFPTSDYEPLLADLAAREIYDGKLSYPEFKSLHLRRFKHFCKEALNSPNMVFFFENALFKNHIHELMGFYDMEDAMILSHIQELISQVLPLNPVLYYVKTEDLHQYLLSQNEGDNPNMQDFISYVQCSNYGRLHGLKGMDGASQFLHNQFRIEQLCLDLLSSDPIDLSILYCASGKLPVPYLPK